MAAANAGARVFAVNHFYEPKVSTFPVKFDTVEANVNIYRVNGDLRLDYQVAGNSKPYTTALPPYAYRKETNIKGHNAHFRWIEGYDLGHGSHLSLVEILPGRLVSSIPVYDKPSLRVYE